MKEALLKTNMSNVLFVSVYHDCEIFYNIIDEMCLLFCGRAQYHE